MENQKNYADLDEYLKSLLKTPTYTLGDYSYDVKNRMLTFKDESTKLTKKEGYLLVLFVANEGKLMERLFMLKVIWKGESYLISRTMDVYISKLRKLLSKDEKVNIVNVHGVGYKILF